MNVAFQMIMMEMAVYLSRLKGIFRVGVIAIFLIDSETTCPRDSGSYCYNHYSIVNIDAYLIMAMADCFQLMISINCLKHLDN